MADTPKSSTTENPGEKPLPPVLSLSRSAVAERLHIPEAELPNGEFFAAVNENLEDLSKRLSTMTGAAKKAELNKKLKAINVQESLDKAKEFWKDGFDAAKKLTPEVLSKTLETTTNKIKTDMWKWGTEVVTAMGDIVSANGIDGLTGGIGKLAKAVDTVQSAVWSMIKGFGDLLAGLMAMLGLDKLWWSIKGLFGMKSEEKKDPKTLAEEAKKKGEETIQKWKETLTKGGESAENYGERMRQKYWDSLIAEGWIKDPKTQEKKFKELWTEYGSKMKKASKETYDMVSGSKNGVLGEQVFDSSQASLSFLVSLVSKGIIPTEALQVKIGEGIQQGIEIGLKSTKSLILGSPMDAVNMLGQFGSSDFESLSPEQRKTILSSVHHSMAVPLYMTGIMTKLVAKAAVFGIYYDHGIGFWQAGAIGYGVLGQYDTSARKMTDLLTMLGDNHVVETQKYVDMFRAIVTENQTKAQVMQVFLQMKEAGKSATDIVVAIEKLPIDQKVVSALLTDLRTSGIDSKNMTGAMTKFLETPQTKDMIGTWQKWAKSLSGTVSMTHDMQSNIQFAIDESRNAGKKMSAIVKSDFAPLKWLNNMRFWVSQAELMSALDKNIFPIKAKDANEAKVLMDRYIRAIPSGFETFFSGLAVSLTIADVWAAKPWEKLETLAHDIYMMNPLVWGAKMFIEWTTMEWWVLTKFAYCGVGGAIFAVGVYDVAKLAGNFTLANASRVALGPIHTVWATAINMARGGRISISAWQALFRPGALTSFRTLKAVGSYATIAGIGYLMYDYQSKKNDVEGMKQAGMLDEKWNIDPTKIKEWFAALPEDKKSGAVKHILDNMFGNEKVNIDVSDMKNITVDSQRTWADGVPMGVDTLSHIREVIASLGISDPRVFLSTMSVKNIKTYIQSLPIAEDMKTKFAGEYGIDLQKA